MAGHIDYKHYFLEVKKLKNCITLLALMTAVQVAWSTLSTILHLQTATFVFNQYDKFLECWQKILFLKKQLQDCINKRCSHLHKGLANFGRGNYEQAIEHLHPLLKLESLSASRKARILILLYESYSSIGDFLNAVKILHSHFYEDILVHMYLRVDVMLKVDFCHHLAFLNLLMLNSPA